MDQPTYDASFSGSFAPELSTTPFSQAFDELRWTDNTHMPEEGMSYCGTSGLDPRQVCLYGYPKQQVRQSESEADFWTDTDLTLNDVPMDDTTDTAGAVETEQPQSHPICTPTPTPIHSPRPESFSDLLQNISPLHGQHFKAKAGQSTADLLRQFAYAASTPGKPMPDPADYGPVQTIMQIQRTPDSPTPLPRSSRKKRVKSGKKTNIWEDGDGDEEYDCSKEANKKKQKVEVEAPVKMGTRTSRRLHGLKPEVEA